VTIVIGIKHKGKVYLGAVGAFLIGNCGSPRMQQIIQYSDWLATLKPSGDPMAYLVKTLLPGVQETLRNAKSLHQEKVQQELTVSYSSFLIAWGRYLFGVDSDFQVLSYRDDFLCIGSGSVVASGSLFSTKGEDPHERLRIALEAACYFNACCAPPFRYLNT
jgi:hypothetical protein